MYDSPTITGALAEVGPRLKRLRTHRGVTLAALSEATGISTSTLSRLESGQRRPSLELLLPIALAQQVPLEELIGSLHVSDPRVHTHPRRVDGRTVLPLTRQPGPLQAFKLTIPATQNQPEPRIHGGYEWLYVLSGHLRLILADHDLTLGPGEVAEFDTRLPHWFGSTGQGPVEILSLFGPQGERMHVRAHPHRPTAARNATPARRSPRSGVPEPDSRAVVAPGNRAPVEFGNSRAPQHPPDHSALGRE